MPDTHTPADKIQQLLNAMGTVVVGQKSLLDRLLIALLTDGHILLEGVPGLAKTLTIRTLARTLALPFHRIQFTPDLLPADIVGTQIYNPRTNEFGIRQGPIFANIILADEINRAPAKVQSALLEAMQERQVTIGEQSFPLPSPFFVLATQNPIEHEGTYPLPEAQLDRFMMKVMVSYPTKAEELDVLNRMESMASKVETPAVWTAADLAELRATADQTYADPAVKQYVVDIVRATRAPKEYGLDISALIQYGASPRATVALLRAAKAHALLRGRNYITPDDVKILAPDCLRHRIIPTFEAEAQDLTPDNILKTLLDSLPVP